MPDIKCEICDTTKDVKTENRGGSGLQVPLCPKCVEIWEDAYYDWINSDV